MSAVFISETSPALVVALKGNVNVDTVRARHDIVMTHLRTGGVRSVVYDIRQITSFDEDAYKEQEQLNRQFAACVLRLAVVASDPRFAFKARLLFPDSLSHVFYDDIAAAIDWTLQADDPTQ